MTNELHLKLDVDWLDGLIADMASAFFEEEDTDSLFKVKHILGSTFGSYYIYPTNAGACARIIGVEGERIKNIDCFIQKVGRAFGWDLRVFCKQPSDA
jgi:hypothetical protein